jgi:group I intron endonuclease
MANKQTCGIYEIRNLINNKVYIGSSYNIKNRWSQHKQELNKNIHNNYHLQSAWNKYGKNNFSFKIIEEIPIVDTFINMKYIIIEKEQYWIDKTNCCDIDYGYNIAPKAYSKLGVKDSDEVRKKKSNAMLQPERRKIASEAMTRTNNKRYKELGKDMCINNSLLDENKVREIEKYLNEGLSNSEIGEKFGVQYYVISDIKKGKTWSHVTNRTYKKRNIKINNDTALKIFNMIKDGHSIEDIQNKFNVNKDIIYNIRNGVTFSNITGIDYQKKDNTIKHYNRRDVIQFDKDFNMIKFWHGICEIEKELGYNGSSISKCCKHKRNGYKNYIWMYASEAKEKGFCDFIVGEDCELDEII